MLKFKQGKPEILYIGVNLLKSWVGQSWSQLSQSKWKLKNESIKYYKVKDILKKTDSFLWMLELCRLILVLTRFLNKLNFSGGGEQTGIWWGCCPPPTPASWKVTSLVLYWGSIVLFIMSWFDPKTLFSLLLNAFVFATYLIATQL